MKQVLRRLALVVLALCAPIAAHAQASDLFISEYIEGSSNNKAIELYNGTDSAVNLGTGNYVLQYYFNGSASDPGSGNPVYTWTFGNNQSMGGQNVAYAYPDNGNFDVSLTSVSQGGTSVDTFPVTITNVAPTVNGGADKVINEGAATAFT